MSIGGDRDLWIWYSPFGLGGVETYLLNMARESIADGRRVWIAATSRADGPLRAKFEELGVEILDWRGFHRAYSGDGDAGEIISRVTADFDRVKPTLLALNDCNDFSIGAAPLVRQLRSYCTVLDTFHIDSPLDEYLDFRTGFGDVLDGIAATNESILAKFGRRFPRNEGVALRYIPNGVSVPMLPRKPPTGDLSLLYVGRLAQDQKRVLELPGLLAALRDMGRPFRMTIVGDGPARPELEAGIAARDLAAHVRFTGYLPPEQVAPLYFEHDAFVNISSFEGFSMSVLEALSAGCVPTCTRVDSLDQRLLRNGENCVLAPVDRLEDLVETWSALTPATLERLSAGAVETGRGLTSRHTYERYRGFIFELRERRPLDAWPEGHSLPDDWTMGSNKALAGGSRPVWRRAGSAVKRMFRSRRRSPSGAPE